MPNVSEFKLNTQTGQVDVEYSNGVNVSKDLSQAITGVYNTTTGQTVLDDASKTSLIKSGVATFVASRKAAQAESQKGALIQARRLPSIVVTLGLSFPISAAVSTALGFIAYRAQIHWYGDDEESAALKAGILALLMAIPTGLPAFLYMPAGVIGFFRRSSPAPTVVNPPATDATSASKSQPVSLPFYG